MKKWYRSKTIWANVVGIIAILAQYQTGEDIIPPETQASILAVINVLLRLITKEGIEY